MATRSKATLRAPQKKERPSSPLIELALGTAWLVGLSAMVLIADAAVGPSMVGAAVAGAVLVDLAAGWAGVRWGVDAGGVPAAARTVGRGAGLGLGVSALVIALSLAAGWASATLGRPSWTLGLTVLRAAALGVRDELLFRGIPLLACERARVPAFYARVFAACAGAAPLLLVPDRSLAALALALALGFLYAALWQRDRSPLSAVGAHAAVWLVIAFSRGELITLDWTVGNLSNSVRASGAPTWVLAGLALVAALLLPRLPGFRGPAAPPTAKADAPS